MGTAIWTTFAVAAMLAIFTGCVIVVATGLRIFENARAKRHRKPGA